MINGFSDISYIYHSLDKNRLHTLVLVNLSAWNGRYTSFIRMIHQSHCFINSGLNGHNAKKVKSMNNKDIMRSLDDRPHESADKIDLQRFVRITINFCHLMVQLSLIAALA